MSKRTKRKATFDVDWLERVFAQIPPQIIVQSSALIEATEELLLAKNDLPSLSASSLTVGDALQIFGLTMHDRISVNFKPSTKDMLAVPDELNKVFDDFKLITGEVHGWNEAMARCFINFIVFQCLLAERKQVMTAKARPEELSSTSDPFVSNSINPSPTTPVNPSQPAPATASQPALPTRTPNLNSFTPQTPSSMGVYFETSLSQTVIHNGKAMLLSGWADYTLGHSQAGSGSSNLVIVEAKRQYAIGLAYGQLLTYMGMVHKARISEGKNNSIVYGLATDGFYYHFWRIDNSSKVSKSSIYDWGLPSDRTMIYSLFRSIIRAAILSSPSTSPVKGNQFASNFSGKHDSEYDFATRNRWEKVFVDEDDSDYEIFPKSKTGKEDDE